MNPLLNNMTNGRILAFQLKFVAMINNYPSAVEFAEKGEIECMEDKAERHCHDCTYFGVSPCSAPSGYLINTMNNNMDCLIKKSFLIK